MRVVRPVLQRPQAYCAQCACEIPQCASALWPSAQEQPCRQGCPKDAQYAPRGTMQRSARGGTVSHALVLGGEGVATLKCWLKCDGRRGDVWALCGRDVRRRVVQGSQCCDHRTAVVVDDGSATLRLRRRLASIRHYFSKRREQQNAQRNARRVNHTRSWCVTCSVLIASFRALRLTDSIGLFGVT
jgi:hypothetical protein